MWLKTRPWRQRPESQRLWNSRLMVGRFGSEMLLCFFFSGKTRTCALLSRLEVGFRCMKIILNDVDARLWLANNSR